MDLQQHADAAQLADDVAARWQQIDQALHPIFGRGGVAALFHRSLTLSAAAHPWLAPQHHGVPAVLDTTAPQAVLAQQTVAEAGTAAEALHQSFLELLSSLVGPALTARLLRPVSAHTSGIAPAQDTSS